MAGRKHYPKILSGGIYQPPPPLSPNTPLRSILVLQCLLNRFYVAAMKLKVVPRRDSESSVQFTPWFLY